MAKQIFELVHMMPAKLIQLGMESENKRVISFNIA